MLSEWLVEVPEDLDVSWFLKICPVGHRCLVVAHKVIINITVPFKKIITLFFCRIQLKVLINMVHINVLLIQYYQVVLQRYLLKVLH